MSILCPCQILPTPPVFTCIGVVTREECRQLLATRHLHHSVLRRQARQLCWRVTIGFVSQPKPPVRPAAAQLHGHRGCGHATRSRNRFQCCASSAAFHQVRSPTTDMSLLKDAKPGFGPRMTEAESAKQQAEAVRLIYEK